MSIPYIPSTKTNGIFNKLKVQISVTLNILLLQNTINKSRKYVHYIQIICKYKLIQLPLITTNYSKNKSLAFECSVLLQYYLLRVSTL